MDRVLLLYIKFFFPTKTIYISDSETQHVSIPLFVFVLQRIITYIFIYGISSFSSLTAKYVANHVSYISFFTF